MEWVASPWTALSLFVLLGGVYFIIKRGSIKVNRNGITASSTPGKPEPLMSEDLAREVISIVERASDHRDKIRDNREEAIEEQMRAYEEVSISGYAILKREFNSITKHLATEVQRREARAYGHMMQSIMGEVKNYARKWFRANHYYSLTDAEWMGYKAQKLVTILNLVSDYIDVEWISDEVSREELRAIGKNAERELEEMIGALFDKARLISQRKFEEANEEKARYSAFLMLQLGYDPYGKMDCA